MNTEVIQLFQFVAYVIPGIWLHDKHFWKQSPQNNSKSQGKKRSIHPHKYQLQLFSSYYLGTTNFGIINKGLGAPVFSLFI